MKKYIATLFLIALIAPSITFASWWNPLTWNWKNIFTKQESPAIVVAQPNKVELPQVASPTILQKVNEPIAISTAPAFTTTQTSTPPKIPSTVITKEVPTHTPIIKTEPSVTLISPNGGESFKAGDNILVKWISSNVSGMAFAIRLRYYDNQNTYTGDQDVGFFVPADSNSKMIQIPTTLHQLKNVYKVSKYKINIGDDPEFPAINFPGDMSDGFFTIARKPEVETQYATPSSTSAELVCTYKYQFGTDNPTIKFEYAEKPCGLTSINGTTSSCTHSASVSNSETYATPLPTDTTERLFTKSFTVSNLTPNTEYNYQCVVANSNGTAVGYGNMSPTTYTGFKTTQ